MSKIHKDMSEILFDAKTIQNRIKELGKEITKDYEGKRPVIICILRGAVVFMTDLVREIDLPLEIDFFSISSYGSSTKSSGIVKIRKDIDTDITGRDVIVVEDIVDSGLSLEYIYEYLKHHNVNSAKVCVLLDKPKAHKVDIKIDYTGFDIGNEFVVGYGLDYGEIYRNIPYIGILKEEIYK